MQKQTAGSRVTPFVEGFIEKAPEVPPSHLVYDEAVERSDFSRMDVKNPLLMSPTHLGNWNDEAH